MGNDLASWTMRLVFWRCNLADKLESGFKNLLIPFLGKTDDEVDTTRWDIYDIASGATVK